MRGVKYWVPVVGVALAALQIATVVHANGEDEEAPANIDAPIAPVPGRLLPFPVKDEPVPIAPPLIGKKALPVDPVRLVVPGLADGLRYDTVLGTSLEQYQSLVVRQSHVERGKVTLPAGSVAYFVEVMPGAAPLGQDALYLGAKPQYLVDVAQTIVVRKGVTLGVGEPVVLGSSAIEYVGPRPLAGTLAAALTMESLGGLPWARHGVGTLEVSISQPAWRARTFREGLVQGRVDDVSAKQVRFAWLSATRTDAIVLANKLERGGKLKTGDEVSLPGDKKLRVTAVSPGRFVTLDTPDGPKTLTAPPDPKVLPEDTEARKKLIVVGKDWAVVLSSDLSDFPAGQAQLFVYSELSWYKNGELLENAAEWRAWPTALSNGRVVGLFLTNDKPVELNPKLRTLEGPNEVFQLITEWTDAGELVSFVVEDAKGTRCEPVAASGLKSIDLVAGTGPTALSLLARVKSSPAAREMAVEDAGVAPAPSARPADEPPTFQQNPVAYARPHLFWALGGAGAGFLIAAFIGMMLRRRG